MNRRLPVIAGPASSDGFLSTARRWLMFALAIAHAALALLLAVEGLPGAASWGLAAPVVPPGWAALIGLPVALGYLGLGLLGLHPRYREDMLFHRIGWLTVLGLAAVCAWQMSEALGMEWLAVPLDLAALLLLGRATMVLGWWPRPISLARRMVVNLPIGLHAGVLTALVPLDILASLPVDLDAPPPSITGGFLAIVGLLALAVAGVRLTRAEPAYVCAILWMLAAIALRGGMAAVTQPVALLALFAAFVVAVLALWTRAQRRPMHFG